MDLACRFLFLWLACVIGASPLRSQTLRIGEVASIQGGASGSVGPRARLEDGSPVHQNETIQTAAESATSLAFNDSTHLSIGPSSSVRLDRFVYEGNGTTRSAIVNVSRGIMRFGTGNSDPSRFQLRTPLATIGIRGTVLAIKVEQRREVVALESGLAVVTVGANSVTLRPGEEVVITPRGIEGPQAGGTSGFIYDRDCGALRACYISYVLPRYTDLQNSGGGGGSGRDPGGGGGGPSTFGSDIRLKTGIERIGATQDGLPLYRFRYKADPDRVFTGVMAQDLLRRRPDVLSLDEDGFYRVDYARLGLMHVLQSAR